MGVVVCPACGQKYSAGPELAGKKIRCRGCGGGVRIPEATASAPPAPAAPRAAAPSTSKPAPPKVATAPKPTPPKPPPPPPDDDFDAYGLAEEPEEEVAPVVTEVVPRGEKAAKGKGKKRRKRGGIGGWIESARENPIVAGITAAVVLGMVLFVAISPYAALPILLVVGVLSVLLGGLATAILIFAQAPMMTLAMIVALLVTLGAVAMLGGVGGAGGGRRPWPMAVAGAAWGALLLRGRQMDIHLDGDAFRIPKRMMGWGAALTITMLVGMVVFAPTMQRARFGQRPGFAQRGPLGSRATRDPGPAPLPDLPAGRVLEPGVTLHEVSFGPPWMEGCPPGHFGKLWVYLPEGDAAPKSLPCVVIAGAGTPMFLGMDLTEGDRPEHLPWVKAGFAVVAYDVDGASRIPLMDNTPIIMIRPSIEGFLKARAGVANTQHALDYIAAKLPQVDPSRIIAAGHSSAATLALLAAENDARLRGVMAFAPGQYDQPPERAEQIRSMERAVPGISEVLTTFNPATPENLSRVNVPVFLFAAEDDDNVPASKTRELASALQSKGKNVTLETTPNGGHYESMIDPGIPKAIAWAKGLPGGG